MKLNSSTPINRGHKKFDIRDKEEKVGGCHRHPKYVGFFSHYKVCLKNKNLDFLLL